MIYDCFQFNNELKLLEAKLNHHASFVDKFIITECPWTYSGLSKRLYYDEVKNQSPFVEFKHKIIHRIYDVAPNGLSNWDYEHKQRNYLRTADFYDNDLIIYADCDEFIRSKAVLEIASNRNDIITLDMKLCWYYLNCTMKKNSTFQSDYSMEACFNRRWKMAKICRAKHLRTIKNLYQIRQLYLWESDFYFTIKDAGWHFSNLGDPAIIAKKFASFSHSKELGEKYEISAMAIDRRKKLLKDPLGRKVWFVQTDLDAPQYILDNKEHYKEFILNYVPDHQRS